jgi:hypothetical protein
MAPQDVLELLTGSLQELYAETMNPADIILSAASRPSPWAALIILSINRHSSIILLHGGKMPNETSAYQPQGPTKKKRIIEIVAGLVVLLIFGVIYFGALNSFKQEGEARTAPYEIGNGELADRLDINAKILAIDPLKGEMTVRVDLLPVGSLTEDDGATANKTLKVYVNGATGQLERTIEKGKIINPFDVTISLDGQATEYPHDSYEGWLVFAATAVGEEKDAEEVVVPSFLNLYENVQGFKIEASPNAESPADSSSLITDITITRSNTVVVTAVAGMAIMWAIAIAVIWLTCTVALRGRKSEAFAFYSGLLFGLFGLRNSLPGTPPIGTMSDFISFFWVEAIVAVTMVITIVASLLRPPAK